MRLSYRILCVDDDPFCLRTLERALLTQYQVITACDGQEAIDRLEDHTVDLVLTDFQMPRMTGLSLLKVLQREHPQIRRILITGCFEFVEELCLSEGVKLHGYLKKPWRLADLYLQVEEALGIQALDAHAAPESAPFRARTLQKGG